ncbi:hypothetical protein CYMTET_14374 [Cymbomonas tetramitiformis]|uniref:Uncharacterized protein n=1 Tax=Cymbomonas tetramitiformis TaxID=36881 RepID=A0AAE0GGQ8_9CHLO|nr:hypothetical protein CYMTET_14374 [Cymbomonas tetramitiformis]
MEWTKSCAMCQQTCPHDNYPVGHLNPLQLQVRLWQVVSDDLVTGLRRLGMVRLMRMLLARVPITNNPGEAAPGPTITYCSVRRPALRAMHFCKQLSGCEVVTVDVQPK